MKTSRVTKQIVTETSHRLWQHPGACKNIHGHSYMFEVTIEGEIDPDVGMVYDFKTLKVIMEEIIGGWDHALILHHKDPFLYVLQELDTKLCVVDWVPTAENMAIEIAKSMTVYFADGGDEVVSVKVRETATSCAEWKKGDSLC